MAGRFLWVFLWLGLVVAWPVSAWAQSASDAIEQLQRSYTRCKSFRARFKQQRQLRVAKTRWRSHGRLAFKRRGKISFRYASGDRVVADGKRVVIYNKKNKTVYRSRIKRSLHAAAASFLLGRGRLKRDFRWRKIKSAHKGLVLRGDARKKMPLFHTLVLHLDGKAQRVLRLMLVDAQGNTNRFVFSKMRCNVPINKKEFRFRAPAGVKVIRL